MRNCCYQKAKAGPRRLGRKTPAVTHPDNPAPSREEFDTLKSQLRQTKKDLESTETKLQSILLTNQRICKLSSPNLGQEKHHEHERRRSQNHDSKTEYPEGSINAQTTRHSKGRAKGETRREVLVKVIQDMHTLAKPSCAGMESEVHSPPQSEGGEKKTRPMSKTKWKQARKAALKSKMVKRAWELSRGMEREDIDD